MPYIKQTQRIDLDPLVDALIGRLEQEELVDVDGQLNYVITRLLKALYLPKYFNYNRAMGLLSCVAHEYYRRVVAPYEDAKLAENGEVYGDG